jgi:hypothetical protein
MIDLGNAKRGLLREPTYQSKTPGYLLLVFGPEAKSRCWLVFDRDANLVYVDRDGDGDLTDSDERVIAETRIEKLHVSFDPGIIERELPTFKVGTITERATGIRHTEVKLDVDWMMSLVRPGLSLKLAGQEQVYPGGYSLSFGKSPATAPVLHLRGPLTLKPCAANAGTLSFSSDGDLQPQEEQALVLGEKPHELQVNVGTPGWGRGSFTVLSCAAVPENVHPVAEIEFRHREAGKPPIRRSYVLSKRC